MKKFKVLLAMMLVLAITSASTLCFGAVLDYSKTTYKMELAFEDKNVQPGDTIKLYVRLYDSASNESITINENAASAFGFGLWYDTTKLNTTISNVELMGGMTNNASLALNNGKFPISASSVPTLEISKDTNVATFTFTVADGLADGNYAEAVKIENVYIMDGTNWGCIDSATLNNVTYVYDDAVLKVGSADPDPVVKDATVAEITEEGWVWTDAKAYKVSTTVEGTVTEVNCALNASYTKEGTPTSKEIYNANLAGIYATEGSTISFRPILLGTDTISDLVVTGTFTLK